MGLGSLVGSCDVCVLVISFLVSYFVVLFWFCVFWLFVVLVCVCVFFFLLVLGMLVGGGVLRCFCFGGVYASGAIFLWDFVFVGSSSCVGSLVFCFCFGDSCLLVWGQLCLVVWVCFLLVVGFLSCLGGGALALLVLVVAACVLSCLVVGVLWVCFACGGAALALLVFLVTGYDFADLWFGRVKGLGLVL